MSKRCQAGDLVPHFTLGLQYLVCKWLLSWCISSCFTLLETKVKFGLLSNWWFTICSRNPFRWSRNQMGESCMTDALSHRRGPVDMDWSGGRRRWWEWTTGTCITEARVLGGCHVCVRGVRWMYVMLLPYAARNSLSRRSRSVRSVIYIYHIYIYIRYISDLSRGPNIPIYRCMI